MKTMNVSDHFRTGSALAEFLAGRLGAPEWWPNDCKVKPTVIRVRRTKRVTRSEPTASRPAHEQTSRVDARLLMNQQTTQI